MFTRKCFEKHLDAAKKHEECVQRRLREADRPEADRPEADRLAAAEAGPGLKPVRLALAQQRLAVREYCEAARLRPRDADTKRRLLDARKALRKLQQQLEAAPQARWLRRFLAHYNLSIRYWDLGKAAKAMEEAELACQELQKARLPCGCAEHNRLAMEQVQRRFRSQQQRLEEAVRQAPEAVGPNYDLGLLLFDKRMLLRAEAQLLWTRERARAASALQLLQHERQMQANGRTPGEAPVWFSLESRRADRLAERLEDLDDDLEFLASLRQLWCAEAETGTAAEMQATGVRDGARPQLLPCMRCRFGEDDSECARWWSEICAVADFSATHAKRCSPSLRGPN